MTTIAQIATSATTITDSDLSEIEQGGVSKKVTETVKKAYYGASKANVRLTTSVHTSSYTAQAADVGSEVIMDVASSNSFTVPPESTGLWVVGDQLTVYQDGAGQTTIVEGAGVTIKKRTATLKLLERYSTIYLRYRGSDVWAITGELSEV